MTLAVPTIGSSLVHPPIRPATSELRFGLTRAASLVDARAPCPPALQIGGPLLGIAQGLYGPEGRGHHRWSMPESRIVFPFCDRAGAARPRSLRVLASCGRKAAPAACRVEVLLNGASLGSMQLTRVFKEHHLEVPDTALSQDNKPVEVRFRGSRFVPAEAGVNSDRRELSFLLASTNSQPASRSSMMGAAAQQTVSVRNMRLITFGTYNASAHLALRSLPRAWHSMGTK